MRFTQNTGVALASNHCSRGSDKFVHIECLRTSVSSDKNLETLWRKFIREVSDGWKKLGAYPHWAKDWELIDGNSVRLWFANN
jgi:hypothetical protein